MDTHPVGATLIHGDGQTNMIKVIGTFHYYLKEVYTRAVFKYPKITHCWDLFPTHGQKLKVGYNLNKHRWHFRIVQKDTCSFMVSKNCPAPWKMSGNMQNIDLKYIKSHTSYLYSITVTSLSYLFRLLLWTMFEISFHFSFLSLINSNWLFENGSCLANWRYKRCIIPYPTTENIPIIL